MTEKVQNPKTEEEALEELVDVVAPMKYRDSDLNKLIKLVVRRSIKEQKAKIEGIEHFFIVSLSDDGKVLIPKQYKYTYPKTQVAQLSLEDYQSACVYRNIKHMRAFLIQCYVAGDTEKADAILPGFSEKYGNKIRYEQGSDKAYCDDETHQQLLADIRENFHYAFPDFLEQTEKQWKNDRKEMMIPDGQYTAISDMAYYTISNTNIYYYMPSEENYKIAAAFRQENDALIQQLQEQRSRDMSENDKDNTRDFAQRIANNEDIKQVTDDLENTTLPNEASERLASLDNVDNELEAAAKEFIDEAISNTPSELQQKYGFDIVYDPEKQEFSLKIDGKSMQIQERDINPEVWNDEHLAEMRKKFSHDVQYQDIELNLLEMLQKDQRLAYMAFHDNTVSIYHYKMSADELQTCSELMQKKYGLSAELAEKTIANLTSEDINLRMLQTEHELSHRDDSKYFGLDQYDLPPQYMAKLNILTEIKASMVQAGYALDIYEGTGELKYFDTLSLNSEDVQKLKDIIKEQPDMPNRREFVAQFVYDHWLENNNQAFTQYWAQVFRMSSTVSNDYPLFALEDNPQALAKYHERVDAMFENVYGIGDARKIVNPDFKLDEDLKDMLELFNSADNEALRALMTRDAQNAEQYAANIMAYLEKVKAIDADGVRTEEEIAQLDAYVQEMTHPQTERPSDDGPNFAATAARKSRGGR